MENITDEIIEKYCKKLYYLDKIVEEFQEKLENFEEAIDFEGYLKKDLKIQIDSILNGIWERKNQLLLYRRLVELKFSPKEMIILFWLKQNNSSKTIIEELNITNNTYRNHLKNIALKIQESNYGKYFSITDNNSLQNPEKEIKAFLRYKFKYIKESDSCTK